MTMPDEEQIMPVEEPESEKESDPIAENRVRVLKLSSMLLAEMFIAGRKIAYEVIENGLPEDAICIGGEIIGEELRLGIVSKDYDVYAYEPDENGVIAPPATLDQVVVRTLSAKRDHAEQIKSLLPADFDPTALLNYIDHKILRGTMTDADRERLNVLEQLFNTPAEQDGTNETN